MLGLIVVAPISIPAVFGSHWEVSVGVVQILSVWVLMRGLQSWGSVYMDAVGRPEVTLWTQLASLCLAPVAVVIGVHWGIEGVAACFVVCQLIAVEIPMFVLVLSQMRLSPRTVVAAPVGHRRGFARDGARLPARHARRSRRPVSRMAGRAALTIALGVAVYAPALWWLAPHISRRVIEHRQASPHEPDRCPRGGPSCNRNTDERPNRDPPSRSAWPSATTRTASGAASSRCSPRTSRTSSS